MDRDRLCDELQNIPRGKPKSGRLWKEPKPPSQSKICKPKTLQTSWKKKVEERYSQKSIKAFERRLKDEKMQKIEERKKRQKQSREQKLLNERKSEITQTITNTRKIKRMKKKQLKKIETR